MNRKKNGSVVLNKIIRGLKRLSTRNYFKIKKFGFFPLSLKEIYIYIGQDEIIIYCVRLKTTLFRNYIFKIFRTIYFNVPIPKPFFKFLWLQ